MASRASSTQSSELCDYCNKNPKFSNFRFCSKTCGQLTSASCNNCHKKPKYKNFDYCSKTCGALAKKTKTQQTIISEVHSSDDAFNNVADQFKASWRHESACPPVRRIYRIIAPPASLSAYYKYRAKVESNGNFVAAGLFEGNVKRRWHGTRRACTLGDRGCTQLCSSQACSLCSIIRGSYNISLCGTRTNWGRFGRGIYTSSTSSKSSDYSYNDCMSSLKAVLLNNVVVGKGYKMHQNNETLTAPPKGYDSVLGETKGILNHDELVVYTNDAIRPSYLVMYDNEALSLS